MDYYNYYEQPDFYGNPQPPKKRGGVVVAIIVTAIVCLLLGALIASFLLPRLDIWPAPTPNTEALFPGATTLPEVQEEPTPTPIPEPTPAPTERPLPEFDGQSPQFSSSFVNPLPDIVDACTPAVVGINIYEEDPAFGYAMVSGGTGFIISNDGYIVTNSHVVDGADLVKVTIGEEEIEAEVIGQDHVSDVAVVKVERTGLTALKIGDSDDLRVGDFVIAIGDPTIQALTDTTTFGIVSALNRKVNLDGNTNEYIQTDAAINPGNSGGPLINMKGEVIGITSVKTVTAGYNEYGDKISAEGLGFAIPINDAMPIVEQLIKYGRMQRPGVGISIVQFTEDQRRALDIPAGVVIYSVTKDSPAHRADLRKYDVITACNGITAVENDSFVDILQSMNVGEEAVFTVWRDGETLEITVTIGDLNEMGNEIVPFETDGRYGW